MIARINGTMISLNIPIENSPFIILRNACNISLKFKNSKITIGNIQDFKNVNNVEI